MQQAISHENGGSIMLVLSRKIQESIVVGGCDGFERLLKIVVLEIVGGRVRLGFEADKDVAVHRGEVWERILADGGAVSPSAGASPPLA